MSWESVAGVIGGIATIIGGLVYFFRWGTWAATKSPAQTDQQIVDQNEQDKQAAEQSGRPV